MKSNNWSWKEEILPKPQKNRPKKKTKAQRRAAKKLAAKRTGFYASWAWKKLRYRVLKHYGSTCMCCGASNMDGKVIVVDHIMPRRKYPALELDFHNMQVLCNDCNMGKSDDDFTDFRDLLPEGAKEHLKDI